MSFNLKKGLPLLLMIGLFYFFWWNSNSRYIGSADSEVLLLMSNSRVAYNSILAHGTYYCMLYVLFVNLWLPKESILSLTRMKSRVVFIQNRSAGILTASAIFSGIVLGIHVGMTTYVLESSYLIAEGFYFASFFAYMGLVLFYWWVGHLFEIFTYVLKRNAIAIMVTLLIVAGMYFIGNTYPLLWTPLKDLNLYERLLARRIDTIGVLILYGKQVIIVIGSYIIAKVIFLEKDMLENEK